MQIRIASQWLGSHNFAGFLVKPHTSKSMDRKHCWTWWMHSWGHKQARFKGFCVSDFKPSGSRSIAYLLDPLRLASESMVNALICEQERVESTVIVENLHYLLRWWEYPQDLLWDSIHTSQSSAPSRSPCVTADVRDTNKSNLSSTERPPNVLEMGNLAWKFNNICMLMKILLQFSHGLAGIDNKKNYCMQKKCKTNRELNLRHALRSSL